MVRLENLGRRRTTDGEEDKGAEAGEEAGEDLEDQGSGAGGTAALGS